MGIFNTINSLKSNIFGATAGTGSTTSIARQAGIELANKSPTSKLDKDPLAFSTLSYPMDLVNDTTNGHYMLFYINMQNKTKFPYTRADSGLSIEPTITKFQKENIYGEESDVSTEQGFGYRPIVKKAGEEYATGGNVVGGQPSPEYEQALIEKQSLNYGDVYNLRQFKTKMRTGLASSWNPTTRITDSVSIYLPPNVQDNYTTAYTPQETGMVGFIAASGGKALQAYRDNDFTQVAETLKDTTAGVLTEIAKNLGLTVAQMLTQSEGAVELSNKIFGRSTNPYMEVLFKGPELRTFTYNFTFAPRSLEEKEEVKKIILLFKFHQAPELRDNQSIFMGLPSEFDIHYMYQPESGTRSLENPYYNKIATCVLQSVNVDYTPGEVRSHDNGAPVVIKMGLNFLETEMITKDHVEAGY